MVFLFHILQHGLKRTLEFTFSNERIEDVEDGCCSSLVSPVATLLPGARLHIEQGDRELIVHNTYDELGQLKTKKVGGSASVQPEISPGLQQVDYTYNVRGWLKTINADTKNDNDLFDFTIRYNDPVDGTPLFNGNISATEWDTQSPVTGSNPISTSYANSYSKCPKKQLLFRFYKLHYGQLSKSQCKCPTMSYNRVRIMEFPNIIDYDQTILSGNRIRFPNPRD